jgi:hypothetical protein
LRIGKTGSGNSDLEDVNNAIIEARVGKDITIKPAGRSLQGRMTTTGRILDIDAVSSQIQIVLRDLRCSDAGQYFCYSNTEQGVKTETVNITARGRCSNRLVLQCSSNIFPRLYFVYLISSVFLFSKTTEH